MLQIILFIPYSIPLLYNIARENNKIYNNDSLLIIFRAVWEFCAKFPLLLIDNIIPRYCAECSWKKKLIIFHAGKIKYIISARKHGGTIRDE